jgi:hypothetical protein
MFHRIVKSGWGAGGKADFAHYARGETAGFMHSPNHRTNKDIKINIASINSSEKCWFRGLWDATVKDTEFSRPD